MSDPASIHLRPATDEDRAFLFRLRREAMRPHVERTWGGWDEADQRRRFEETSDFAAHEIIEVGGEAVGCRWVRELPDAWELCRIYLLPEVQGRGIGTRIIDDLCEAAARQDLPVRLRVLRVNEAQRLYRRLGFEVVGETEFHVLMERPVR
ncbi:MAG: GNAT family N-acetyltransferase [Planctomycetota bacterium]